MKKDDVISIIRTIIIALSIILSSYIIGYYYYESNRYCAIKYLGIVDKYNGTVKAMIQK